MNGQNSAGARESYAKPALTIVGSFEDLTQANGTSGSVDASFIVPGPNPFSTGPIVVTSFSGP